MTRTINQLKNEVLAIQKLLDKVVQELDEYKEREKPQVFEVVLKITTSPITWGEEFVSREHLFNHLEDFMFDAKNGWRMTDEGDEIDIISVKELPYV